MDTTTLNSTDRLLRLVTGPMQSLLTVNAIDGVDKVSTPFFYHIQCGTNSITPIDMRAMPIGIEAKVNHQAEYFHGIVSNQKQTDDQQYTITIRPWYWFLSLTQNCRAFENKSVIDVAKALFSYHQFNDVDFSHLRKMYPPQDFLVQFNESDFDFLQRIFANAGIFYCFNHYANKHIMVLYDHTEQVPLAGTLIEANVKHEHSLAQSQPSAFHKYTYQPYPKPTSEHQVHACKRSIPAVAQRAMNHSNFGNEALHAEQCYADSHRHATKLSLRIHHFHSGERIQYRQAYQFILQRRIRIDTQFTSEITLIDTQYPYQPKPIAWPKIPSLQTAIVTGKQGKVVDIDKNARIHVQFHWDQDNHYNEHSSCWLRVASLQASPGSGHFFTPRLGQEVIVSFIDGHPNQPIVLGTVPNSMMSPAFDREMLPHINGIKTQSFMANARYQEFSINDQPDQQQMRFSTCNNFNMQIQNNYQSSINYHHATTIEQGDVAVFSYGTSEIQSTQRIRFCVGSSEFIIDATGIHINANQVNLNPT